MIMGTAVGTSLSGVMLLTAESMEGVDPFFPAVYGSVTNASAAKETSDECIGHPNP